MFFICYQIPTTVLLRCVLQAEAVPRLEMARCVTAMNTTTTMTQTKVAQVYPFSMRNNIDKYRNRVWNTALLRMCTSFPQQAYLVSLKLLVYF